MPRPAMPLMLLVTISACGADAPASDSPQADGGSTAADGGVDTDHDAGGGPAVLSVADLSPMAVGTTFDYAFQGSGCASGSTLHMEVIGVEENGDVATYEIESVATCVSLGEPIELAPEISLQRVSADEVSWKLESTSTWRRILAAPIADGASFETGIVTADQNESFQWSAVPAISVPAGDYTDCWQTSSTVASIDDVRVYCPGVGLVRRSLSSEEGLTGMTLEELVAFER